ncbi:MAG: hypothetical protein R3Y21_00835 [Mycoplasmatota bacterium]
MKNQTPPPSPRTITSEKIFIPYSSSLSNLGKYNEDEIKKIRILNIDIQSLKEHGDILIEFINTLDLKRLDNLEITFLDYESAILFNKLLPQKYDFRVSLADDGKNMDRSYIDLTAIDKFNLHVPISYLMWDIKFNDEVYFYDYITNFNDHLDGLSIIQCCSSNNVNKTKKSTIEDYKKVSQAIYENSSDNQLFNLLLVSNYLQRKIQYISGYESEARKGIYTAENSPYKKSGCLPDTHSTLETIIYNNYGLCGNISFATNLLLNNPKFNINCRIANGNNHLWNEVDIDGCIYYLDNTWNITRNTHQVKNALKATQFSYDYILFGSQTAQEDGHIPKSISMFSAPLSKSDYPKDFLEVPYYNLKEEQEIIYPKVLAYKTRFTPYKKDE